MRKGFSLIEIMIAVTILGVAIIPMMSMLGTGTRSYVKTQNTIKAYNLGVEGLEWMKSMDFLGNYWKNRNENGFFIFTHYSYELTDTEKGPPIPIMYVYNAGKVADVDDDPENKKMLSDFTGYYSYLEGNDIKFKEVQIFYPSDHFRRENISDFKRWCYFKLLDNNTAMITCVVTWSEGRLMTADGDRMEKIFTVVVNNANVQQ
ncbi:MAG: hypothetical protein C0601_07360 [Candidatus Muiribacterium halophilum]|uniref:Prepilin-type N-terminal cleavage/methylation domain-containing protein n=1 Tax=Muiribacterium halophilum TaxID=2053465 RepID=A0A2N5ZFT4_MUIH1|nr:MAG: hypothetical protein C0601_07360 [Candidatus Muirbacterium halophilum]